MSCHNCQIDVFRMRLSREGYFVFEVGYEGADPIIKMINEKIEELGDLSKVRKIVPLRDVSHMSVNMNHLFEKEEIDNIRVMVNTVPVKDSNN